MYPLLFNLGMTEIIVILLIIVLLFGGKKIPELMRGMGRGVREFKDAMEKPASGTPSEEPERPKDAAASDSRQPAKASTGSGSSSRRPPRKKSVSAASGDPTPKVRSPRKPTAAQNKAKDKDNAPRTDTPQATAASGATRPRRRPSQRRKKGASTDKTE